MERKENVSLNQNEMISLYFSFLLFIYTNCIIYYLLFVLWIIVQIEIDYQYI